MEPLRGRKTLSRKGASADNDRASTQGEEQGHPRVGAGALLQQRAYEGGPRLLRRRGHLLRAQGQGERHSALHLRDDRGPEDSRGRGDRRLPGVESPISQNSTSTHFLNNGHKRISLDSQGEVVALTGSVAGVAAGTVIRCRSILVVGRTPTRGSRPSQGGLPPFLLAPR